MIEKHPAEKYDATIEVHSVGVDYETEFGQAIARLSQDVYEFRAVFVGREEVPEDTVDIPAGENQQAHIISESEGSVTVEYIDTAEEKNIATVTFANNELSYVSGDESGVFEANERGVGMAYSVFSVLQLSLMKQLRNDTPPEAL